MDAEAQTPSFKDQLLALKKRDGHIAVAIDFLKENLTNHHKQNWLHKQSKMQRFSDTNRELLAVVLTKKIGKIEVPYYMDIVNEKEDWALRISYFDVINEKIDSDKREVQWEEYKPSCIDMKLWKQYNLF